jgi:hypothetical protein
MEGFEHPQHKSPGFFQDLASGVARARHLFLDFCLLEDDCHLCKNLSRRLQQHVHRFATPPAFSPATALNILGPRLLVIVITATFATTHEP